MSVPSITTRIAAFAAGALLLAVALEALLWLLPVNTRIKGVSTDRSFPIARAQPHQAYVHSFGWDFLNVVSGRTNNAGTFNSRDYDKGVAAIGVIGDSYIEARMLSYGQTLQGHLDHWGEAAGFRAYAASAGGAGLADYLALADVLSRELHLGGLAILVNEGDVLDALAAPRPGFMGLRCEGGRVSVRHLDYVRPEPTALRQLAGGSALMRYLDFNLKVMPWLSTALNGQGAASQGGAMPLDQACLRAYFRLLSQRAGLPPGRIVLVVDGMRGKLDRKKVPDKYHAAVRALADFRSTAQSLGFGVVDMQPVFDAAHRRGMRVDFSPRDNHWNGLGHRLAAREVVKIMQAKGIGSEGSYGAVAPSAAPLEGPPSMPTQENSTDSRIHPEKQQ